MSGLEPDRTAPRGDRVVSDNLGSRRPVRRCPECTYVEKASRLIETSRWRRWGARTRVLGIFESIAKACPVDGNRLAEECEVCREQLVDADDVYCRRCGNRYWWAADTDDDTLPIEEWRTEKNRQGRVGRLSIYAVRASIARIGADAVVSSDRLSGVMASRSAKTLKRIGGEEVESESMAKARDRNLGDAWSTAPGALPVRTVIHVAILDAGDTTRPDVIDSAYANVLQVADDSGVESLACTTLGAGRSRFPLADSVRSAQQAFANHVAEHPKGSLKNVVFVMYSPAERADFVAAYTATPPPAPAR